MIIWTVAKGIVITSEIGSITAQIMVKARKKYGYNFKNILSNIYSWIVHV